LSLNEEMRLLKEIPLFAEIDESKLKLIAFISQRLRYQPGEQAIVEGDQTDSIYVIISGEADVEINTDNGPLKVAAIGKHGIFGEIGVLCEVPRTASIVASTELEVLRIDKAMFLQLLADFPAVARVIMNELGMRLARALKFISKVPKDQAETIMESLNINLGGRSGRVGNQDEQQDEQPEQN